MAPAPILILLAPVESAASDPVVLGLSLVERAEKAARRSGYADVFVLGGAALADWGALAAKLATSGAAPLALAPANILAERRWLEQLAEAPIAPIAWAALSGRVVLIAPGSVAQALAALEKDGDAVDLSAVETRLAARLGPPARLPADIDPMRVENPADIPAAERRLMGALVKDTDGFMARHVERPISLAISRRLAPTAITPNQMSLVSIAVGICGGPFFLSARPLLQTIGALLFLAHSILDGCDGELARLKFQESRWGGVLDFWGDNVVHVVIFACMALGWSLSAASPWPLLLGAGAVLGTLGSAGFVYWRLMRTKASASFTSVSAGDGVVSRALDAASRRDFIYLVVLLALFGRSNWFVLLAGIGAPVYFALVVLLAMREVRAASG